MDLVRWALNDGVLHMHGSNGIYYNNPETQFRHAQRLADDIAARHANELEEAYNALIRGDKLDASYQRFIDDAEQVISGFIQEYIVLRRNDVQGSFMLTAHSRPNDEGLSACEFLESTQQAGYGDSAKGYVSIENPHPKNFSTAARFDIVGPTGMMFQTPSNLIGQTQLGSIANPIIDALRDTTRLSRNPKRRQDLFNKMSMQVKVHTTRSAKRGRDEDVLHDPTGGNARLWERDVSDCDYNTHLNEVKQTILALERGLNRPDVTLTDQVFSFNPDSTTPARVLERMQLKGGQNIWINSDQRKRFEKKIPRVDLVEKPVAQVTTTITNIKKTKPDPNVKRKETTETNVIATRAKRKTTEALTIEKIIADATGELVMFYKDGPTYYHFDKDVDGTIDNRKYNTNLDTFKFVKNQMPYISFDEGGKEYSENRAIFVDLVEPLWHKRDGDPIYKLLPPMTKLKWIEKVLVKDYDDDVQIQAFFDDSSWNFVFSGEGFWGESQSSRLHNSSVDSVTEYSRQQFLSSHPFEMTPITQRIWFDFIAEMNVLTNNFEETANEKYFRPTDKPHDHFLHNHCLRVTQAPTQRLLPGPVFQMSNGKDRWCIGSRPTITADALDATLVFMNKDDPGGGQGTTW